MLRLATYVIGLVMFCTGAIHSAVYLNLIPSGFTVTEYIIFMSKHTETYGIPLGAILIQLSVTYSKKAN